MSSAARHSSDSTPSELTPLIIDTTSVPLVSDTESETTQEERVYPWKYRAVALASALLLAVGSHYAAHTLGTLKAIVKADLGITNAQYGVLQSSVSVVNTILPIIGGILVDSFGTSFGSVIATILIASGNILVALSANFRSFPIMIAGRILYGLGSGAIVVVQGTILSHWFRGKGLAWVVGLQIAVSRLASYLSMATVVPIMNWTGWYGYSFWFSAFLCILSCTVNVVYIILMRIVRREEVEADQKRLVKRKTFHPSQVFTFPPAYWWLISYSFTIAAGWTTFLHINSELIKLKFGGSDHAAARTASIAQFLPIFVAPFAGYLHEKWGHRCFTLGIAAFCFAMSATLLLETSLPPVIPMIIFSLSLTAGPVALTSGVHVVLPLRIVGTGLGVNKSMQNVAVTLFDIINGLLQDGEGNYDRVLMCYIVIGCIGMVIAVCMSLADKAGHLHKNRAEVEVIEVARGERQWWSWLAVVLCLSSLFLSWGLFLHYLL